MSDYEYPVSGPGHRSIRAANRRAFSRQNLIIAASVIALAAIVLVITWFALGFNVRTEKTCEVINVADTASVNVAVWKVTTSCGTHFINSGDFIDQNDPAQIAASLVDGETYKLTFSGNDHDIVAATPVKG